MTTASERVFNAAVRHRINFSRYSSWMVRRVIAQLNVVEKAIVARLAATAADPLTGARLEALLAAIRVLQAEAWVTIRRRFTDDLAETASAEIDFADRLTLLAVSGLGIGLLAPRPPLSLVMASVMESPFQGSLVGEALDGAEARQEQVVRDTIRGGFAEGLTAAAVIRALRGTQAARFKDGALERNRRGVAGLVRTVMTHTSVFAHEAVYRTNADVVSGVEWVSVLDDRTTRVCTSRNGKVYPIGVGPRPPAHPGCRSSTVPVVATVGASVARPTYPQWLAQQSVATQDDILGPERGRMLRSGGIKIESFVDRKGAELTLEQLRARDAAAVGAI